MGIGEGERLVDAIALPVEKDDGVCMRRGTAGGPDEEPGRRGPEQDAHRRQNDQCAPEPHAQGGILSPGPLRGPGILLSGLLRGPSGSVNWPEP